MNINPNIEKFNRLCRFKWNLPKKIFKENRNGKTMQIQKMS